MKHSHLLGRWLLSLVVLTVCLSVSSRASAQEEYVDTVFHDNIDRTDDDFVVASVCIVDPTDWRDDFLGVLGHAFIRLQCKAFDMDYCFSYESEDAETQMGRFLRGQLCMGMFSVPTDEYLQPFRRWNRTVREYRLNLPPDAKQRLWEIMDNKVAEGPDLQFDLEKRGCTQTLVQFVERALGEERIEYGEWPEEFNLSRRDMVSQRLQVYPWIRLFMSELLLTHHYDEISSREMNIQIPSQLEEVWTHATVKGRTLMEYKGNLVEGECPDVVPTLITPLLCAIVLLLLVVGFAFTRFRWIDWPVLLLQFLVGAVLCWLAAVSNLPGTKGAHLIPIYCPLVLLLWRWRRMWAMPYVVMLLAWVVYLSVSPDYYVETAHKVFAITIAVILSKDFIKSRLSRKA